MESATQPQVATYAYHNFHLGIAKFLVACYATLQPALSVCRSVGRSVGRCSRRTRLMAIGLVYPKINKIGHSLPQLDQNGLQFSNLWSQNHHFSPQIDLYRSSADHV